MGRIRIGTLWGNVLNSGTDEKVKYDAADPTAGYLADKIIPGTNVTIEEGTGADENKLKINASGGGVTLPELLGEGKFGKLYNGHAVRDSRGLAATGWDIASRQDYIDLETYAGGASVAGGKLNEPSTDYWTSVYAGTDNALGFSARGSGRRNADGTFGTLKEKFWVWTSTTNSVGDKNFFFETSYNSLGSNSSQIDSLASGKVVRVKRASALADGTLGEYIGNDGHRCKTIVINGVEWSESIRETQYRDGSVIPNVTDATEWSNLSTGACCDYDNTEANSGTTPELEHNQLPGLQGGNAGERYHLSAAEQAKLALIDQPFQLLVAKDITPGTAQSYELILKAREALTIESLVVITDNGTLTGCSLTINGTAVQFTGPVSTFDISTTKTELMAVSANAVAADAEVVISTSTGYTGTPTLIKVQLNYKVA